MVNFQIFLPEWDCIGGLQLTWMEYLHQWEKVPVCFPHKGSQLLNIYLHFTEYVTHSQHSSLWSGYSGWGICGIPSLQIQHPKAYNAGWDFVGSKSEWHPRKCTASNNISDVAHLNWCQTVWKNSSCLFLFFFSFLHLKHLHSQMYQ